MVVVGGGSIADGSISSLLAWFGFGDRKLEVRCHGVNQLDDYDPTQARTDATERPLWRQNRSAAPTLHKSHKSLATSAVASRQSASISENVPVIVPVKIYRHGERFKRSVS